jgi:hypothetical protein
MMIAFKKREINYLCGYLIGKCRSKNKELLKFEMKEDITGGLLYITRITRE